MNGRDALHEFERIREKIMPDKPSRMVTRVRKLFLLRGVDTIYRDGEWYNIKWKHL